MNKVFSLIVFISLTIFLASCDISKSNNEAVEGTQKTEKTEEVSSKESVEKETKEELPYDPLDFKRSLTSTEKMMLDHKGALSGDRYNKEKLHDQLDRLSGNLTEKQYYNELLNLLKEDYTEPIKKLVNYDVAINVDIKDPNESINDKKEEAKNLSYVIMLDSSGSMAGKVNGTPKMDIAKSSISEFASNLPKESKISLRVYGHEGTNQQKDKIRSCNSVGELFNGTYEKQTFEDSMQEIQPSGWTPIAKALNSIKGDITEGNKVVVYIVSDGIETCDGDPVQTVKDLKQSGIDINVNIIGFDIENNGQKLLKEISDEGNGEFKNITSQEDLDKYLRQQSEMLRYQWSNWKDTGVKESVQLSDDKRLEILDTENEIKDVANREYEHLVEAKEYLENRFPEKSDKMSELSTLINNRYGKITSYARETSEKMRNDISSNGSEKIKVYTDKGNQKVEENIK